MTEGARRFRLLIMAVAAVLVLLICPFLGLDLLSPQQVVQTADETVRDIFWQIRVPRVMVGFLAGAGLAVCGMAFQAMFRNPLATPFTLGVASGASLGASIYLLLGLSFTLISVTGDAIFAFFGALGSIFLVYGLTRVRRGFSTATLLLAGVAVSLFFSSLIMMIQYLSTFSSSFRIVRWLMGGLGVMGYDSVFNLLPLVLAGIFVLVLHTHELNLLTTGDDLATSRGVDVLQVRRMLFFATSLVVGGIVAVCGPIGFVGLMVPHICRLLIGSNHRYLLPACFFFGGAFLVLCDTAGRSISTAEVPVGVITSLLGGPFFLWLLVKAPQGSGLANP